MLKFMGIGKTISSVSKNITDLKTTKIDFKKVLIIIFVMSSLLTICLSKDTVFVLKIVDRFLYFVDLIIREVK
ncbi:MAG: hypothetical protein ACRC0S_01965 [Fusobacteriaceae bacterium]